MKLQTRLGQGHRDYGYLLEYFALIEDSLEVVWVSQT